MLRAVINVLSDISCSSIYWGWGSESIKETPHFHLLLRPFAELSSANGLNLRLQIFLSDSNIPPPRRFVASLSHGFQPQTVEFRANPTQFLANPSRIPRGTVTDEVARWIWPICWHQLFGFSIVVAFLKYVTISTTTCLTGSHTQTRRGAIFKQFL